MLVLQNVKSVEEEETAFGLFTSFWSRKRLSSWEWLSINLIKARGLEQCELYSFLIVKDISHGPSPQASSSKEQCRCVSLFRAFWIYRFLHSSSHLYFSQCTICIVWIASLIFISWPLLQNFIIIIVLSPLLFFLLTILMHTFSSTLLLSHHPLFLLPECLYLPSPRQSA